LYAILFFNLKHAFLTMLDGALQNIYLLFYHFKRWGYRWT